MTINTVQKYNGRSLDSIEKIKAVARHIAKNRKPEDGLVIVVSAMGDTADKLIALAREAGDDLRKNEIDMLLATGDQQTVALLAIALQAAGVNAQAVAGLQTDVMVDNPYATVRCLNTSVIENVLAEGKVAVGLTNPDGKVSYAYSANGIGFWIAADGTASSWGDAPIYYEYDASGYGLTVGHNPGHSEKSKTYIIKPTMVYNKGGKLHKAVITIKMKFA